MRKRYTVVILLLVLGLLSITFGVTVAFFNYTKTGQINSINVGKVSFNSTQNGSISLTNVFPVVSNNLDNNDNVGEYTLTITGDTTYNEGIEYLISADEVVNTVNSKIVPIGIRVAVSNLGEEDYDYFANRGGNTSIYTITAKETIESGSQLLVGYITKGSIGVNGNVNIKAFIDGDKVAISDTYNGSESSNMGTTEEWVDGRTVLTTEEWNSLSENGISFKVKVEANEG